MFDFSHNMFASNSPYLPPLDKLLNIQLFQWKDIYYISSSDSAFLHYYALPLENLETCLLVLFMVNINISH